MGDLSRKLVPFYKKAKDFQIKSNNKNKMSEINVYDNSRKFLFSNWTNEDFVGKWGGVETIVKVGETKEFEMSLAYHFTKHLVDRELQKQGKSHLAGVPEERKPLEDKTLAELLVGQDSPALATLKAQIKAEVLEAEEKKTAKTTKKSKKEVKEESLSESKEFEDANK